MGGEISPLIALEAHRRKSATSNSWRMDEIYVKVNGKLVYLHRAFEKRSKTLNFMLSEHRSQHLLRRYHSQ
ncbi:DDE-type integrase/transposase/recombinase [Allorhizobium sonneratiae]|uniref:DDE-type integrase/transposase/recombinase n=1 Tax=Allorhizobium sonneratiae TaxID=2934936 RepID=UPI003B8498F5